MKTYSTKLVRLAENHSLPIPVKESLHDWSLKKMAEGINAATSGIGAIVDEIGIISETHKVDSNVTAYYENSSGLIVGIAVNGKASKAMHVKLHEVI